MLHLQADNEIFKEKTILCSLILINLKNMLNVQMCCFLLFSCVLCLLLSIKNDINFAVYLTFAIVFLFVNYL